MEYSVGYDIGGTYIRIAIVSEYGNIVKTIKEETGKIKNGEDLRDRIVALYEKINAKEYGPIGLGIGICGPVYQKTGYVYILPNIGIGNFNLKKLVQEKIDIPVFVGNDANMAGLAEAKLGSGINHKIVQYITVSTGIGGALIINGKVIEGRDGFAQEIGHMIISSSKRKQSQATNFGSWESQCSGTAIYNRAIEEGLNVSNTRDVFELEKKENPIAKKIIGDWIKDMGVAIANINLYIEPNIYIIGGGVSNSAKFYFDKIKEEIDKYIFEGCKGKITLVQAKLGPDSGIIGAALQAFYISH